MSLSLEVPSDLQLPLDTQQYLRTLDLTLSPDDGMFDGNHRQYLSCGATALNVILSALRLVEVDNPAAILDFGSGAGRVTRWFRAAFPLANIDACDLRQHDLTFCRDTFGAKTWTSTIDIFALHAPSKYDLIWLGSVATHLSAANTERMLKKMLSWANPGGLVVMSFHGRFALERQNSGNFRYIHDEAWEAIRDGYRNSGYGYADYEGQNGYGISVAKLSWMASMLEDRVQAKLVVLSEKAWDGHHDVIAVQAP